MFVLLINKVMKRFLITSILAAIVATGTTVLAQDKADEYLGLPGDNLNLYAVMKLFQESETIEGFERSLNDENSRINNLDLNGDNLVDYIRVNDYVDGDVHTIVLQDVLGRNESQDVAVFTVQRFRDGSVQIQLIGDEELYGKNYIIEPIFDETPNPGYLGRSDRQNVTVVRTTTVQIATWPLVRFIFLPNYAVWRSSYYWGYYPGYWHTWRPFYWDYYYGYHYHWFPEYYSHYRHWDHHRYTRWNDFYYNGHRAYSRNVAMRINEGRYRNTYSHPEQRKEGEALFVKSHPDRSIRQSVTSTGNGSGRRSVSSSSDNGRQEGTGTGTSRRSNGSVNSNSGSNRNAGQNNGAVPRSTSTVDNRANTNSTAGKSTVNSRRSSESVTNKSVSKPAPVQNSGNSDRSSGVNRSVSKPDAGKSAGTSRRSSETSVSRPASKPESGQRAQTGRSTKQSTSNAGSSARRSSSGTRSQAAEKKSSSKSDESRSNASSRRR